MPTLLFAQVISGTWRTRSSVGFTARVGTTSSVVNGKIYVIGGTVNTINGLSLVEVFDPATNTWNTPSTTGIFISRLFHTSCVVDNKIYVIGGVDQDHTVPNLQIFDPSSNTWTTPATTGPFLSRFDAACGVVDGKIFVIGGNFIDGSGFPGSDNVEIFDPLINKWSVPTNISGVYTHRKNMASCTIGNKIYIIGGDNADNSFGIIQAFDVTSNTWSTLDVTGKFTPRASLTCSVIAGKIFTIGGANFHIASQPYQDTLEVFNPFTSSWTTGMTNGAFTPRYALTSSELDDQIYVMGGKNGNGILNTNEVFTPILSDVAPPNSNLDIQLSPNPTMGNITISHLPQNIQHITITNILGETMLAQMNPKSTTITFDLSKFTLGIYNVRVTTPSSVIVKKIVLK